MIDLPIEVFRIVPPNRAHEVLNRETGLKAVHQVAFEQWIDNGFRKDMRLKTIKYDVILCFVVPRRVAEGFWP